MQELIAREVDTREHGDTDEGADTDDVLDEILHELRAIRRELADDDSDDHAGGEQHSTGGSGSDER